VAATRPPNWDDIDSGQLPLQEQRTLGDYILVRELARGGQGVVWEGHHPQINRRVAIKLLLSHDEKTVRRFRQEAQVLARLDHPHLLKVIDLGESNGRPYMVTEFVGGADLGELVKTSGLPDANWIADVLLKVAGALAHCHDSGVIHRDIKPTNILIEEGTCRPVIVDFGLVKRDAVVFGSLSQDALTKLSVTGEAKGTPAYMPPEQADASLGETGPWSDVYSLGATLYYLLVGKAPYTGATFYNVIVKLLRDDPSPTPLAENHNADPVLANLCAHAMSKKAEDRPGLEVFAEELRRFASAGASVLGLAKKRPRLDLGRRVSLVPALALTTLAVALATLAGAALYATRVTPQPKSPLPPSKPTKPTDAPTPPLPESLRWSAVNAVRIEGVGVDVRGACAFLGDDSAALLVHDATSPEIWDLKTSDHAPLPITLPGQPRPLEAPLLLAEAAGRHVLCSRGGKPFSLVPTNGAPARRLETHGYPTAAAFTDDGSQVLVGSQDGRLERIDLKSGESIASVRHSEARTQVGAIAVFGNLVASASGSAVGGSLDSHLQLWRNQELTFVQRLATNGPCTTLAFSPDGKRLAFGTNAGRVFVYDLGSRRSRPLKGIGVTAEAWVRAPFTAGTEIPVAHASGVRAVLFSPDGRLIYTISNVAIGGASVMRTWDAESYDELAVQNLSVAVTDAALSPDGSRLLLASWNGRFRICERSSSGSR
jgi:serine/threonine protein kinase